MNIIEINKYNEIPRGVVCHGYVAEPSVENAIQQHQERYKVEVDKVYYKRMPSGRCSVYIPVDIFTPEGRARYAKSGT